MKADLSSGDLARATGVTLRAIRFYEEQGLLRPALVSEGGHRRYTSGDLERLRLIADLRELGLSIFEIRGALELRTGCEGGLELAARFQEVLRRQIQQAEQRLIRLRRVKRELQKALGAIEARMACDEARCPCEAGDSTEAPSIVRQVTEGAMCEPVPAASTCDDREGGAGPNEDPNPAARPAPARDRSARVTAGAAGPIPDAAPDAGPDGDWVGDPESGSRA